MKVEFEVSPNEFTDERKKLITSLLCAGVDEQLHSTLSRFAKAAFIEYLTMLSEGGMPNRADEGKQVRLFQLIQHFFQGSLPTETEICSIFCLSASQSRTLLRNTLSRYRTKIDGHIRESMRAVLLKAEETHSGAREVVIASNNLREELNLIVSRKGPTLVPIRKDADSAQLFIIDEDTYHLLCEELGVEA